MQHETGLPKAQIWNPNMGSNPKCDWASGLMVLAPEAHRRADSGRH